VTGITGRASASTSPVSSSQTLITYYSDNNCQFVISTGIFYTNDLCEANSGNGYLVFGVDPTNGLITANGASRLITYYNVPSGTNLPCAAADALGSMSGTLNICNTNNLPNDFSLTGVAIGSYQFTVFN